MRAGRPVGRSLRPSTDRTRALLRAIRLFACCPPPSLCAAQLEFHATIFTASKNSPTATLMDALNFAQSPIGTSINVNTSSARPRTHDLRCRVLSGERVFAAVLMRVCVCVLARLAVRAINNVPAPMRFYNSSFASQFHTYKIVWDRTSVAWMVDTVVYRNLTYAPWRPMSIRQILRTNKGINAVGPQYADSNVYIRRIRYTPLSAQAIADAYRCTSSYACYGAMAPPPMATATSYVSLASTAAAGSGRRKLLQVVTDGGVALEAAVASIVPGMPRTNVTAAPTAFGLSFRVILLNLQGASGPSAGGLDALGIFQGDALQSAMVAGLADDVIPPPENVIVQSITEDATGTLVYVNVLVMGYATAAEMASDYNTFANGGAAQLDSTAAGLNNALGLVANMYVSGTTVNSQSPDYTPTAVASTPQPSALLSNEAICPSYPGAWDATCLDASGNPPSVWCASCVLMDMDQLLMVTTYGVTMPVAASAVDVIEAQMNSAISSGTLASAVGSRRRLLQSGGSVNLTTTNNLLIQRLMTSDGALNVAAICASEQNLEMQWRSAAIAFIVLFGITIVALIAFSCGKKSERREIVALMAQNTEVKSIKTDITY
jgi:hypothetical protein